MVTVAQYKQIQEGMSRAQVQAIMGWPGTVSSESIGEGLASTVVEWQDSTTSSAIIVSFINDTVQQQKRGGVLRTPNDLLPLHCNF